MRRPCAIAALAAALLAAGGSPAAAQVAVPRDAPVVAGPTPSGATLVAFEHRGELCIAVRDRNARDDEPTCGRVPRRASDTLTVTGFTRDQAFHGGATSGDVATAQLHFARRGRPLPVVDAPTEAGARFRGPGAGRLRFFLAQGPATTPWLARYLAADGRTLAATGSRFDSPSSRPAVTLATGSAGRRLRVTSRQALAATPLDRGRLVEEHCLELQGSGGRGPCATVDEPLVGDLAPRADRPCGRTSLTVATSARVTRVDAVLGDGRRAAVPLSALPAGLPLGTRGGALIVDGPTAIRRLEGFDAAGGRVATEVLALPPAQPCGLGLSGRFDVFGFPFHTEQRGPLALQVRDDGARLCLSLGTPDPRGADCAVPPVDTFGTSFRVRRAGGRALVATVLSEEVAAVDLEVDGRVRRIATTPDVPGYGGQYSGAVRFFVAEFPARTALGSARLLDAEGRLLRRSGLVDLSFRRIRSLIVREGGIARRVTERAEVSGLAPSSLCFGAPRASPDDCTFVDEQIIVIEATCSPARIVLFGGLPYRGGSVVVRTSRGALRPRIIRLGGLRMFLAVVPRDAALRAVEVRVRRRRSAQIVLPPAGRQCGYADLAFLE